MKSPCWKGDHPQTAGEYYSSGSYHGSWDVGMPSGNEVYAPCRGKVLDANTGVPNQPGGSGSPSNWLLLGFHRYNDGQKVCLYYQHLKDAKTGLIGEWVEPGTVLGHSGNSGNSSGPHLHLTLQAGWKAEHNRYDYLNNANALYPPSKVWDYDWKGNPTMPLSNDDLAKIADRVWNEKINVNPAGANTEPRAEQMREVLRNIWNKTIGLGKPE